MKIKHSYLQSLLMHVCNPLFTMTTIRQPGIDSTSFIIFVVVVVVVGVGVGGGGGGAAACTQD
jgi:hypothetical protein